VDNSSRLAVRSALIAVSDLERSIEFYVQVADLTVGMRDEKLVLLRSGAAGTPYLYLREQRQGTRYGQGSLGLRGLAFQVPPERLGPVERRLRHFNALLDRGRVDGPPDVEFARGYDPDRLPLVFVASAGADDPADLTNQRIANLLYGLDV